MRFRTLGNLLIGLGLGYLIIVFSPIIKTEAFYWWAMHRLNLPTYQTFGQVLGLYDKGTFGELLNDPPSLRIKPVNFEGSIVAEKINLNSPIVWDVSVTNKNEYFNALKKGVAHAKVSAKPSKQNLNTYLFAHSTLNPLEIKKYSASFTLLNKLQKGDLVVLFYQNKRFDYRVKSKSIVSGFNLDPLTRSVTKPTLTLQTCNPPGIPLNRLIVTAELENVWE